MNAAIHHVGFNQKAYLNEIDNALNTLCTTSTSFMIPTALASFRRGINPVKANYQYLQVALLTNDCEFKTWFINYLNETNMIEKMIIALSSDIQKINLLLDKYKCMNIHDDSILKLEKLNNDFTRIKIGLEEYHS